jgi:hypothetical protein
MCLSVLMILVGLAYREQSNSLDSESTSYMDNCQRNFRNIGLVQASQGERVLG